jgi:Lon protease-like protein
MVRDPCPMFPLGSVLFPHSVLPLHVFEPRYRQLTEECLAGDGRFGVVLIERGSEVGGGDVRFDVGTVAQIVQAGRFDDGRYALITVGVQRMRVRSWLTDEPYPRAEVEQLADDPGGADRGQVDEAARLLERVLALHAELGAPAVPAAEVDDEVVHASFQLASRSPLGPLDAQALLELDDAGARLGRLADLLTEEAQILQFRLSGG